MDDDGCCGPTHHVGAQEAQIGQLQWILNLGG